MNRLLLIALVLACLALAAPPPVPKRIKRVHGPTKGDGAAALLVKPKLLPPPPAFVWLQLDWDYPGPLDGIAFNIYQKALYSSQGWNLLAQIQGSTRYQFPVSSGENVVWFTVTAVNLGSGLESSSINR